MWYYGFLFKLSLATVFYTIYQLLSKREICRWRESGTDSRQRHISRKARQRCFHAYFSWRECSVGETTGMEPYGGNFPGWIFRSPTNSISCTVCKNDTERLAYRGIMRAQLRPPLNNSIQYALWCSWGFREDVLSIVLWYCDVRRVSGVPLIGHTWCRETPVSRTASRLEWQAVWIFSCLQNIFLEEKYFTKPFA